MQKIKVNDEVIILAGKDKGKTGKVLKLNFKTSKALIEGVNIVKKAVKPTQENPSGGIVDKEQFVHMSNISLISPKSKTASRVRIERDGDKKVRVLVKCGTKLD